MPIQMTRAEYEAKYGQPPDIAPIKMTQAEYDAKYNTQQQQPTSLWGKMKQADTALRQGTKDLAIGALKGIGKTILGAGELGAKGLAKLTGEMTPSGQNISQTTQAVEGLKSKIEPVGTAQKIGAGAEQVLEFFVPGTASLKVGKVIAEGAKIAKGLTRLGATGLVEGVLGTGQSALQSGELGKREATVGAVSTIAPAVLAGAGKVIKAITPTPIKEIIKNAVSKAFSPSVKSITNPKYYDKAEEAIKILARNKKDFEGVVRNPETRMETLETLRNAKKLIYNDYSSLAEQATEKGVGVDTLDIIADTINTVKNKGWSQDLKDYAITQAKNLVDLRGASPAKIQDRIEELNNNINPFSTGKDKIKSQIDFSIAEKLRGEQEKAIMSTVGEGYQALRNEYSALKTIEKDLTNAAAKEARKGQKGLLDFTDIFTGADIAGSILTANPAMLVRGLAGKGIKEWFKWLNDPNVYLKKAFEAIDKTDNVRPPLGVPTQKLLPVGQSLYPQVLKPINLPAKGLSTLEKEEIKKFGGADKNFNRAGLNKEQLRIIDEEDAFKDWINNEEKILNEQEIYKKGLDSDYIKRQNETIKDFENWKNLEIQSSKKESYLNNPELENQYIKFKSVLNRYFNPKSNEKLTMSDDIAFKNTLKDYGWKSSDIDNMLYSQEKTGDEVFADFLNRYNQEKGLKSILPEKKTIKKELPKADEFIKKIDEQGDQSYYDSSAVKTQTGKPIIIKAFHGTDKQFDKFIIPEKGIRYTGDGVYFYPAKGSAKAYASKMVGGRVVESYLDLKNPYNMYLPEGNIDWQPGKELLNEIRKKGHDSIVVRMKDTDTITGKVESDLINEIVVFKPEQIKTKQELIDIWNEANKK